MSVPIAQQQPINTNTELSLKPKLYIYLDHLQNHHFTTQNHQVVDIDVCYITILHRRLYIQRWELILKTATRDKCIKQPNLFVLHALCTTYSRARPL